MGIDKKYYNLAFSKLDERRQNEINRTQIRKNKIYNEFPELREIDKKMAETTVAVARLTLSGDQNATDAVKKIADLNLELQKTKKQIFIDNNIDEESLKEHFGCEMCSDTGYNKDGKMCDCVKNIARTLAYQELNLSTPLDKSSFQNFDTEKYPDDVRNIMSKIFEFCKNYAYDFKLSNDSLMFMGKTGLGKTHLSLAIAGVVIEKGYGVIYGSLSNLLSKIENEHFSSNSTSTIDSVCNCDLLIIDDLGTEFSTPFTRSTVYEIINHRQLNSKPTIISTNLSIDELEKAYTQRVVSRICGKYRCFEFLGNDIRFENN